MGEIAMKVIFASVISCAVLMPAIAVAATGPVIFNGTVTATCTLNVTSNGVMVASPDLQSLSSHNIGGSPGLVSLSTTGGVSLSVDPVTLTTVPPADLTPITWAPSYAVSGAHSFAEGDDPNTLTAPGSSTVTVHLAGTKGGSDTFATGAYQATVTVRCE